MGPFSKVFNEKMEKARKKALIDSVKATVKKINAAPSKFAQPKNPRIPERGLKHLMSKFCPQMTPGKVKLDIRAMNRGRRERGELVLEEVLFPLLDGLAERGGVVDGKKLKLHMDVRDFDDAHRRHCPMAPKPDFA